MYWTNPPVMQVWLRLINHVTMNVECTSLLIQFTFFPKCSCPTCPPGLQLLSRRSSMESRAALALAQSPSSGGSYAPPKTRVIWESFWKGSCSPNQIQRDLWFWPLPPLLISEGAEPWVPVLGHEGLTSQGCLGELGSTTQKGRGTQQPEGADE